jgi:hypothetical protein
VTLTGFPLPRELLGGVELNILRQHLARRLVRLDPRGTFRQLYQSDIERLLGPLPEQLEGTAPVLTFAVGGAGAQAEMADDFLPSLRDSVVAGHIVINLVAGTRADVAERFVSSVRRAGLEAELGRGVHVVRADDFETYYRRFNAVLGETDILWTKPSELSFYAALGIPLVLAKPVGSHERFNRKWLRAQGVALKQEAVRHAAAWLEEWLEDGTLAAAAWTGFVRLPKDGTYRVLDQVRHGDAVRVEADHKPAVRRLA